MRSNADLQKDVQNAIKWEPLLNAAEIGVTAKDGVVTLTGVVDSYSKKAEAEDAAKNVLGVKAVVEKIEIKYPSSEWSKKDDNEIATEVLNAFKWNALVPDDVKVKVEKGWVTLDGEARWNYQRDAAKKSIQNLTGVTGVTSNIKIKEQTRDTVEKHAIEGALARNWTVNDQDIQVKVAGNKVTLNGVVNSWFQKEEAERIAWNAPGIWSVDNLLAVEYALSLID